MKKWSEEWFDSTRINADTFYHILISFIIETCEKGVFPCGRRIIPSKDLITFVLIQVGKLN